MCNLRFCFAVVRFYIRCAQSFIIKLFVLNIKKINSRYVFRVCELAFSHHCPSLCSMHIAHCMRRGKMHNSFVYSYVILNVHAFVFTQIALNVHDNQACTCSLIHYHTMGTPSTSDSNAILFVSLSSFFFFQTDHLGFVFMVTAYRMSERNKRKSKSMSESSIFDSIEIEISVALIFIRLFRAPISHTHTLTSS